ncbi:hypothetical protein ACX2QB_04185 [Weissella viridescens]
MEKVSKEMMNKLNYIRAHTLEHQTMPLQFLNDVVEDKYVEISEWYRQQRYLAEAQFKLIEHVFGDTPQFEEKPNKYIVQIKNESAKYSYLKVLDLDFDMKMYKKNATKFNTREEAEKWINPLMEVVEVEE